MRSSFAYEMGLRRNGQSTLDIHLIANRPNHPAQLLSLTPPESLPTDYIVLETSPNLRHNPEQTFKQACSKTERKKSETSKRFLFLKLSPSVTCSCRESQSLHCQPLTWMGQNVSLQLVRPVELFIAACVASAMTTNADEMWESAKELIRSQFTKRSMTFLLSSP